MAPRDPTSSRDVNAPDLVRHVPLQEPLACISIRVGYV
jgi:hypothetical protein